MGVTFAVEDVIPNEINLPQSRKSNCEEKIASESKGNPLDKPHSGIDQKEEGKRERREGGEII